MLLQSISIYLFLALGVVIFLAMYIHTNGKTNYMKLLALLCLLLLTYLFGYLMELNSQDLNASIFWIHFQYLALPFINGTWLLMSLSYVNRRFKVTGFKLLMIYLIPSITFLLNLTNRHHNLYYTHIDRVLNQGVSISILSKGPWYYVQSLYILITTLWIIGLFYRLYRKGQGQEVAKYRLFFIASSIPVVTLLAIILDPFALGLDYTALTLPIVITMMTYAIIHYGFMEIKIIAREAVFEDSHLGMVLMDREGHVMDYNQAALAFFSEHGVDLKEQNDMSLLDAPLDEAFKYLETTAYKHQQGHKLCYYEIETRKIYNPKGNMFGFQKTIRDVTATMLLQNNLEHMAKTDPLSQLNNRGAFISQGRKMVFEAENKQTPLCLMMADVDYFKRINDTYGHGVGDLVIEGLGAILIKSIRPVDLTARMGGEEFAVLIPGISDEDAIRRAEELRSRVAMWSFNHEDKTIRITVSIGVAKFRSGMTLETLMTLSDRALYKAKDQGRNQVATDEHLKAAFDTLEA